MQTHTRDIGLCVIVFTPCTCRIRDAYVSALFNAMRRARIQYGYVSGVSVCVQGALFQQETPCLLCDATNKNQHRRTHADKIFYVDCAVARSILAI